MTKHVDGMQEDARLASNGLASTSGIHIIHGKPFTRRNSTFQVLRRTFDDGVAILSLLLHIKLPLFYYQHPVQLLLHAPCEAKSLLFRLKGHLAPISCVDDVDVVMSKLLEDSKTASATHNILGYRVYDQSAGKVVQVSWFRVEHVASACAKLTCTMHSIINRYHGLHH
jgi:hypothetical protein